MTPQQENREQEQRPSAETRSEDIRERIADLADLYATAISGVRFVGGDRSPTDAAYSRLRAVLAAQRDAALTEVADLRHQLQAAEDNMQEMHEALNPDRPVRAEAADLRHQLEQCQAALRACREGGTP